jgi:hypothetical protein
MRQPAAPEKDIQTHPIGARRKIFRNARADTSVRRVGGDVMNSVFALASESDVGGGGSLVVSGQLKTQTDKAGVGG